MPEPRNLTPDPEDAPRLSSPPAGVIEADSPSLLNADRSIQRASLYFFIFVVLLVGAVGPVQPPAQSPEDDLIAEALRPMRSSRPRREPDPAPDRPWESRTRLVIGEDHDSRVLMTHCVEDLGCNVLTAGSTGDGFERARRERLDLIFLDPVMPVMDGTTFLKRLHREKGYGGSPVIICTEKALTREDLERLQARCVGVVAKGDHLEEELGAILTQLFSPAGDPPSES